MCMKMLIDGRGAKILKIHTMLEDYILTTSTWNRNS